MRIPAQFQAVRLSVLAHSALALLASLTIYSDDAQGQIVASITDGTRVRVTAPGLGLNQAVGVVRNEDGGGSMIDFEGPWAELPLASEAIQGLDVSVESRSHEFLGGLLGLLAGGALGGYLGAANGFDEREMQRCNSRAGAASVLGACIMAGGLSVLANGVLYGLLGGGVGLLVGRSIGGKIKTDVWTPAGEFEGRFSVTPTIRPEGTSLAISVSF